MVRGGSRSMVYPINQRVITLEEYGKDNFKKELERILNENSVYDKRNIDWFQPLIKNFEKYVEWFFLFDGETPVAFSTIQEYYPGCYRLLTRTYIYRDYRRFTSPKDDTFLSPTMCLYPEQVKYLGEYESAFISMQDLKRRNSLERFSRKLVKRYGGDWSMHPEMFLTCDKDWGETCWQSILYSGKTPKLNTITIDEWKHRYGTK